MCGISGVFGRKVCRSDKLARLNSALQMISHRGPDDRRIVTPDETFSGGTVRLGIEAIDLGFQPITVDHITVGFNGEIFNYKQLAKAYDLEEAAFTSEVRFLVEAWQSRGIEIFDDLDGQFAIFIYDSKLKKLILSRDPFGIRPIFYTILDDDFYFCSEIKGIFKLTSVDYNFDEVGVAEIAMLWATVGDRTVFQDIKQIKRGHYAVITSSGLSQHSYYNEPLLTVTRRDFSGRSEAADFLRFSLERSIQSQIHGEVGYATYLSGGIDSSALAYFLSKRNKNHELDAFSITFESEEYDESDAQKVLSRALNINHHTIRISKTDIARNFRSVINHAETLLFRTAPVPLYMLSKKVHEAGHKVVYTGEGADEILLGYDLFAESRIRRFWSRSPSSTWRPELLKNLYSYLPQFKNSRYFTLIREFYGRSIFPADNIFYSHLIRWSQFKQVASFFNFSFSVDHLEKQILSELSSALPSAFKNASHDRKAQILEFETLLHGYLLSSQGDRMSMAHSVEGRYPFLGKEFVSRMAQIDDYRKTHGIKSKDLFRAAMEGFLPQSITSRPKVAYQAPEAKSFLSNSHVTAEASLLNDLSSSLSLINRQNLFALNSKLTSNFSTERMGFRENMAYIMCMSLAHLSDLKTNWR